MATQINEIYGQMYSQNIMALAQQKYSKLIGAVYMKPNVVGKAFFQDRIGEWTMTEKVSRNSDTPSSDPNLSRRKVIMRDFQDAVLLDKEDELKVISDPKSAYTLNAAKAIGRQIDDVIIAAAFGTAYGGETGATSVAFSAEGQTIADGSANLTFAKVRAAKEDLDNADVEADERFFVTSPAGLSAMLGVEQVTSSDYAAVKALVNGEIDSWMGFKWITSTRLDATGDVRDCVAFQKYGLCLGMAASPVVRTDERADKSYAWQIYYGLHLGATRLEGERVVKVQIDETK